MSGAWNRVWNSFRSKATKRLAGRDLEGNRFYESSLGHDERPRRTVEYATGVKNAADAASRLPHIPIQWSAWLAHTRTNPPSIEELQKEQLRLERLSVNLARLKAEDEEEMRKEAIARQSGSAKIQQPSQPPLTISEPEQAAAEPSQPPPEAPPSRPIGSTAEPQSWTPQTFKRS